jgi:hypothetical protein
MSDITTVPAAPTPPIVPEGEKYTASMVESLKQMRPWVLFQAILGIVGCGFLFIAGLIMLLTGAMIGATSSAYGLEELGLGGIIWMLAIVYLLLPGALVAPIVFMFRFYNSVSQLLKTGKTEHMENALRSQKSYWKYTGIMVIVGICAGILIGIIAVIVAIAAVSRQYLY